MVVYAGDPTQQAFEIQPLKQAAEVEAAGTQAGGTKSEGTMSSRKSALTVQKVSAEDLVS